MINTDISKCPICNKARSIKGIHIKCSKMMQQISLEKKKAANLAVRRKAQYKYSIENKDKIKDRAKRRFDKLDDNQKEDIRKAWVKWSGKPESKIKRRINAQNRRAKKKNNGGVLTKGIKDKLFLLQNGKCACCKKDISESFHLDHIVPLAKGGVNDDSNIQLLCPFCNMSKGAKHPIDFMQSKGYLL